MCNRSYLRVTLIGLACVLLGTPAHSELSAKALALACSANVPNLKRDKDSAKYAQFCNAYITAWDDARFTMLRGTTTYCPPTDGVASLITIKELSVVFFDHQMMHKAARNLPAAEALMLAFQDKWPCTMKE